MILVTFLFHRIRGLVKTKALHEQISAMEQITERMKVNKEQVHQQVEQLKQRVNQLIADITVGVARSLVSSIFSMCRTRL